MTSHPLLVLPPPEHTKPNRLHGGSRKKIAMPDHGTQVSRLDPLMQNLSQGRMEILSAPTGLVTEKVLVVEIIGDLETFVNEARRLGMQWLGAQEAVFEQDNHFYRQTKSDAPLAGQIYVASTNVQALQKLVDYFERYKVDPDVNLRNHNPLERVMNFRPRVVLRLYRA